MYSYKIKFIALQDSIAFEVESEMKEAVEEFVQSVLAIFFKTDDEGRLCIESLQKYSKEIQDKIDLLNEKYKIYYPQLNQVPAFFRKLKENELFFFLPNLQLDAFENLKFHDYLRATEEGRSFEEINKETTDLFGELMKKYEINVIGNKRISIGEPIKEKRVCRFCNNNREKITFNNKAHAISEGLGNKTTILFDECDSCNAEFSQTIEPEIIQYLSLFRTIFDIKGKGGSKSFEGENFNLKRKEAMVLSFNGDEERPTDGMPYSLKLETGNYITLQNIYKCLCKYFLSVIDSKYLPFFQKTNDWINGKIEITNLPKIGEMTSYHAFSIQPKLVTYIRKSDDKSLPYAVGEFYFTCKIFAFIIPLTGQDTLDFTKKEDYEKYWNAFQHYSKIKDWTHVDYSNNKPRKFVINLDIKKREAPESQ
jgi:hypothetical protein